MTCSGWAWRRIGPCLVVLLGFAGVARGEATTMDLWPGKPPGETGKVEPEKATRNAQGVVTSLTNVSTPTLSVYRAPAEKATGVAIVVAPGGGYNNLAWDHEGEQVARWLNSIGVTAAVLKYRVPRREGTPRDQPPPQALMDAQRALSIVRSRAADWGVDAKRIGMLGFSAGGHLTAWAATNSDHRAYEPVDDADKASCRPDFAVLIYPGGVVKRDSDTLAPEIRVSSQTPPCFFAHAGDDRVSPENSVRLYLALKRAGVPAGAPHLQLRRPRLRPPPERQAQRELAVAVRSVAEGPRDPQGGKLIRFPRELLVSLT